MSRSIDWLKVTAASAAILCLLAGPESANSQTISKYQVSAQKRDALYDFKREINGTLAVLSMIHGDGNQCRASHNFSPEELNQLRKRKIEMLYIDDRTDPDLLKDPALFPHLKLVALNSRLHTDSFLEDLASSYNHISILCISDGIELSAESTKLLKSFRHLDELELYCSLASPALLAESLPKHLRTLQMTKSWTLPSLPNLEELRLHQISLDTNYLEQLDCPNLRRLILDRVSVVPGSLSALSQFHKLRQIDAYCSLVDLKDLQTLQSLSDVDVLIM